MRDRSFLVRLLPAAMLCLLVQAGRATGAAEAPAPAATAAPASQLVSIPFARIPFDGVLTGGQPTPEQLGAAARAGFRTVINLRAEGEPGGDADPAEAARLGLRYVWIPVAGTAGLTRDNVEKLDAALREALPQGPVLLHCGSGNRVGALLALRAAWLGNAEPEAALKLGVDAGMTHLEPEVRKLLGLAPPTP